MLRDLRDAFCGQPGACALSSLPGLPGPLPFCCCPGGHVGGACRFPLGRGRLVQLLGELTVQPRGPLVQLDRVLFPGHRMLEGVQSALFAVLWHMHAHIVPKATWPRPVP